jgi:diguanylate cyclase (GGDEF)-like protein/PAS domain S-box-containing protein
MTSLRRTPLTSSPTPSGDDDFQAPLVAPLRIVLGAMIVGLGLAAVANFAFGRVSTGAATALGAAMSVVSWKLLTPGRVNLAATITFYGLVIVLMTLVIVGHGTRDYGLIAVAGVVFAASLFLKPRAYWILAGSLVGSVVLLGVAESAGWYRPRTVPVAGPREILNIFIIVAASAFGGRGIMYAIRTAIAREKELSGALQNSQERIQKIFLASQNPIVVSRLDDGRFMEVNDAYLALFGYDRDEVIGHSAVELRVWEDAQARERFVEIMRERGRVRDFEARMRKSSGEMVDVRYSAELIEIDGESCLLVSFVDVTAQHEAERRAESLATRDGLTGLPNRVAALDRVHHAMQRASASGLAFAVMHFDIDRFKSVNESLGYAAGDTLIREVASRIGAAMARGDTLARIAGDEFLVIAESLRNPGDAKAIAERLIGEVQRPFVIDGRELHVTVSAGVSVGPDYAIDAERLLRRAETAMHLAKCEGRGEYRLYDKAMSDRTRDRLFVESNLRQSIAKGELRLVYQPKFALATGAVTGLEALVRWRHPELGEVSPSSFIPIAEESDVIHELGAWVLGEACSQLARWQAAGLACVPVAVNLSASQFTPELPRFVADCTRGHGIAPGLIELEVTESMLIKSPETARRLLQQIATRGSRIMLDDFGVGYSSLNYIKELDLNGIKIDRSFIRDLVGSKHDAAIVKAIVGLAHGLGLSVVGEGIEFEAQAALLKDLGCDEGQGFYFSRPVSGEEIAAKFLAPRKAFSQLAG